MIKKALIGAFILCSFNLFASEFVIKEVHCKQFDSHHTLRSCLVLIKNDLESAAVLLDEKIITAKIPDPTQAISHKVFIPLDDLLMLNLEEEEAVRDSVNFPGVSYYSITSAGEFKLID